MGLNIQDTKIMLYQGTKQVHATPMSRGEYNDYRGWTVPQDENPNDKGYLVEDADGDASNHPQHKGYISWSPKDVFERTYKVVQGSEYPPHQQRVLVEEASLGEKIEKLEIFINSSTFATLVKDELERNDMVTQLQIMKQYREVLLRRISRF